MGDDETMPGSEERVEEGSGGRVDRRGLLKLGVAATGVAATALVVTPTDAAAATPVVVPSYTRGRLPRATTAGSIARVSDSSRGLWMATGPISYPDGADDRRQWVGLNGHVVNIREFGAKGDGLVDDSAAFVAAIEAAGLGGSVALPAGIYRITKQIDIFRAVSFVGLGTGATTAVPVAGLPTSSWLKHDFVGSLFFIHGFDGDSAVGTGVMFKNLTFWQTSGSGTAAAGIAINAQGSGDSQHPSWIRIEDCNFEAKLGADDWEYCVRLDGTNLSNGLRDTFMSNCRLLTGANSQGAMLALGCKNLNMSSIFCNDPDSRTPDTPGKWLQGFSGP